ncbi:hypothetical protein MT349_14775 [Rathayibacter caricis]|uniref:hypothetical protein n=1 Tax=Rathayibacter caricis TaxID=110936 RepID=UPI001FB52044|nr:hypothetical protein [Rathayibacter caricis]MCJ1697044.1 hypothetical protein [Rathayibacter caricis]
MRPRWARAVSAVALVSVLSGCARQPTAGIDDQILVAEEVGDGMVAAAEALHPVAVGADLTVSARGGTLPTSRDDERSVDLFFGLRTGTQYDVEDLIEERHPEWRSPDGVLPR